MKPNWHIINRIMRIQRSIVVLLCADIAALILSTVFAFELRFDGQPFAIVYGKYALQMLESLPVIIAIYLATFLHLRLYRRDWRFAGTEVLWRIIIANTIGATALVAWQGLVGRTQYPRSIIVLIWISGIITTGAIRIGLRVLYSARHRNSPIAPKITETRRAVILGGGALGARILRATHEDPSLNCYDVIGFLDDDPAKHGLYIGSAEVLGPIDSLQALLNKRAIDEVIVAIPEDYLSKLRDYVIECRRMQLPVRKVPYLREMLFSGGNISLTDFSVEDLLHRPQIDGDTTEIAAYLRDKHVLVTGAGGSIGSELCRQIARQLPSSLILLGHGENSIFNIQQELKADYPEMAARIHCVIAHISHRKRMAQVFQQYSPQVVFHAAAHKHVPMMETNCQEAIYNNVLGTSSVVDTCGRFGVERMVMISTDKAVDPCCIMGATKWLCEETVIEGANRWKQTAFITVRFGNVLGSRGSVVPIFQEQIRRGGPVTVTHPDMTRYFMTIPEAVRLVLQAGAVGESGQLYLLDMGEPVRILDLVKDMICLCGLRPMADIPIEFTGTRGGERLHEHLVAEDEHIDNSKWPGLIHVKRHKHFTTTEMHSALEKLEVIASSGDSDRLRACLKEFVPSFCDQPTETPTERTNSRIKIAI